MRISRQSIRRALIALIFFPLLAAAQWMPEYHVHITPAPAPVIPHAQVFGAGTATAYYWLSPVFPQGEERATSVYVARIPNTLSSSAHVLIQWNYLAGSASYRVYKTSTAAYPSGGTDLLCSTTGDVCDDIGQSLSAGDPPAGFLRRTATVIGSESGQPAVTATIRDTGGQVFDLRAYGAVGDGIADDSATLQAAINAAHAASPAGGSVLIPPGTYKIVTPPTMYSGIRLVSYGSIDPPAIWSKFNGAPFNSFTPPPGSQNLSQLNITGSWTLQDLSQIAIDGLVLDFTNSGNLSLVGVSSSQFSMAVVDTPITAPALILNADNTNTFNATSNKFDNLILEGGSEGIEVGNGAGGALGVTESTFGQLLILADAQPTGAYKAVDFVGNCDSNTFRNIHFWHTTAITNYVGITFNSASATADKDADNIAIDFYDETGGSVSSGASILVNPSFGNYFRTGVLANTTHLSNTAWAQNSGYVWMDLGHATGANAEIVTLPVLNIDNGTPAINLNKAGVLQWEIYSSSGILYFNNGANTFWMQANGQMVGTSYQFGGGSGPILSSGTGAPSGSCIIGSLYANLSGGASTTLYVCTGASTWTPK